MSKIAGPSASLLQRLRTETCEEHKRIEQALPLFRPSFSAGDYVHLLRVFLGFYLPFEAALDARHFEIPVSIEVVKRKKAPLLRADLAGIETSHDRICQKLPTLSSWPEIAGALYVTEGSTLGGQIIFKHLLETLKIETIQLHFFSGYNISTASMWQSFRGEIERVEPKDHHLVLRSAIDTFVCLRHWLESECPQG